MPIDPKLATVVLFLAVRHHLHDVPGVFGLGRWQVPVAVASIVWLLFELSVLLLPSMFWSSVKLVGVFLVAGIIIFGAFMVFSRSALEEEPGAEVLETAEV